MGSPCVRSRRRRRGARPERAVEDGTGVDSRVGRRAGGSEGVRDYAVLPLFRRRAARAASISNFIL